MHVSVCVCVCTSERGQWVRKVCWTERRGVKVMSEGKGGRGGRSVQVDLTSTYGLSGETAL